VTFKTAVMVETAVTHETGETAVTHETGETAVTGEFFFLEPLLT